MLVRGLVMTAVLNVGLMRTLLLVGEAANAWVVDGR